MRLLAFVVSITLSSFGYCDVLKTKKETRHLELSDYVTIAITVPEIHADTVREAMGRAEAGPAPQYI